jgi:WD40 repeat protein
MFTILKDKLISCSIDQTIKIWSLDNSSLFKNADKTLYDHEEEIVFACVCPQHDRSLMASADVSGQIIVRDITEPDNPICHIKPEIENEPHKHV